MKILLIRPPQIRWVNEEKRLAQPLGLLYVAGALKNNGYGVELIDAAAEGYDNEIEIKEGLFKYGLSDKDLEDKS